MCFMEFHYYIASWLKMVYTALICNSVYLFVIEILQSILFYRVYVHNKTKKTKFDTNFRKGYEPNGFKVWNMWVRALDVIIVNGINYLISWPGVEPEGMNSHDGANYNKRKGFWVGLKIFVSEISITPSPQKQWRFFTE